MRREGIARRDAGWCPTRKPEGIAECTATRRFSLPGAGIVKREAASPLHRFASDATDKEVLNIR